MMQKLIELVVKKQDVRLSYRNHMYHCIGNGNVSRRVSIAESVKKTLVYLDERQGNFKQFLKNWLRCVLSKKRRERR